MSEHADPKTPTEWQSAVDAAEFWLLVDSARQYGLVTGGPSVDTARCLQLLEHGRVQVPGRGAAEQMQRKAREATRP